MMKEFYKKSEIKQKFNVGDKALKKLIEKGIVAKNCISDRITLYWIIEEKIKPDSFEHKFDIEYIKPVKSEDNMRVKIPYIRQYKTKKNGVMYYFGVNKKTADKVYAATGFLLRNKNFTDIREAEKYAWDMYENYIKQTLKSYSKQHINKGSLKYIWKEFRKARFVKENATRLDKTLAQRTQKDYEKCYAMLSNIKINTSIKFVDINLSGITQPQARDIYSLLYKEIKDRWAKMCMDFVRGLFNFGKRHGLLVGDNPFAMMGIPKAENEQKLWTDEDINTFCNTAEKMGKPNYALAVKLNMYLSLRPADFLKLKTSDIKEDKETGQHYVETISNKTKIRSFGYIPEELYNQIDKNKDKLVDVSLGTFQQNFRKIVVEAGLNGCVFKNIRNTAITNYFEAGANVGEVVSVSGHKKAETALDVYRKNTLKQSNNAYTRLRKKQAVAC